VCGPIGWNIPLPYKVRTRRVRTTLQPVNGYAPSPSMMGATATEVNRLPPKEVFRRRGPFLGRQGFWFGYLRVSADWCREEGVEIWGYCLMPNHTHLIAEAIDPQAVDRIDLLSVVTHERYWRQPCPARWGSSFQPAGTVRTSPAAKPTDSRIGPVVAGQDPYHRSASGPVTSGGSDVGCHAQSAGSWEWRSCVARLKLFSPMELRKPIGETTEDQRPWRKTPIAS
jgi:hypothetical protein